MKILLLDIETAPHRAYVWGLWDQNVAQDQIEKAGYTLCWAAKWLGDKKAMFASVYRDGRKAMLRGIYDLINEADVVIHYNGTRFDMPTLNQEFVKAGLKPPAPYKQIDLLKTVKKQFRLPMNKLDYVAQHLGLPGKRRHKGMALWTGCMEGDAESWKEMEGYNRQDVEVLQGVYEKLKPWVPNHPNHALYNDSDSGGEPVHICPSCGGHHLHRRGTSKTATMIYQRYQCQDCGAWSRERTNMVSKEKRKTVLVQDRG